MATSGLHKTRHGRDMMPSQRLGDSGLKVSRIILGCMAFGNPQWEGSPWVLPEAQALPLLKKAFDVGINTWETADTYSNGWSESIIGKALRQYDIPRSRVVLMSKLYYPVLEDNPNARPQPAVNDGVLANQMGLSRKHIFEAVEASLRRLNTSYIDVLQIHRLDHETSPAEIMKALHDLVQMGKVIYIGASSMHTWEFARLNYIAKANGWTTFTSMSGLYNLLYREEEREMIPFCQAEGIGLIPWSPVARGLLTRPFTQQTERSQQDAKTQKWFQGEQNQAIIGRVEELAAQKQCSMSSVALAWLLKKGTCPIVGLNSIDRIEAVSEALAIDLADEEMNVSLRGVIVHYEYPPRREDVEADPRVWIRKGCRLGLAPIDAVRGSGEADIVCPSTTVKRKVAFTTLQSLDLHMNRAETIRNFVFAPALALVLRDADAGDIIVPDPPRAWFRTTFESRNYEGTSLEQNYWLPDKSPGFGEE
ncbi:hypothetical protein D0866_02491 [Hortaea werneckii]|uniref:NADP-dependent oxidoreductase domain-containing protein n=1 Tax=Hortaea werneckii TaxID=91943 RepID=A0A3M7BFY6_HORWE|nr:hypothetical protein D0866_02491 [Hortaea werneckii]